MCVPDICPVLMNALNEAADRSDPSFAVVRLLAPLRETVEHSRAMRGADRTLECACSRARKAAREQSEQSN